MCSFSQADLKPGMWVVLSNGTQGVLIPTKTLSGGDRLSVINERGIQCEALIYKEEASQFDKDWSIVAVYSEAISNGYNFMSYDGRELLWKYTNCKEMTISEIEEILGYHIKIIK